MKKLAISSIILGSFALAACDKYDINIPSTFETEEFYLKNEDKARKVVDECKKIEEQNEKILMSLSTPSEQENYEKYLDENNVDNFNKNCKRAEKALNKIEWDKSVAELHAKEEANTKAHKEEILAFVQELRDQYGKTWQEGVTNMLNTEKKLPYYEGIRLTKVIEDDYFKIFSSYLHYDGERWTKNFKSDYYVSQVKVVIYGEYRIAGINELMQKEYKDLIADTSYCKTDRREYSVCDIWESAVARKRNEVVNDYLKNYEKLKTDYNQCVVELENYLTSINVGKNDQVNYDTRNNIREKESEIYSEFPCAETQEALKQLNLSFSHYEKLD
ncbi:hypothetical protein BKG93_08960 [Rodentibacter ratti]|uniref:Lysozyme inhibitor LprI N-terminal domain-containing protein n=1 Tax=Rodentibacter ratti TaxID=1906745 RepID=A0A1V3L294_9PAST|nr:hypothetical protein [Rodentibacter ratti]OOF83965.1 hypothetical protein BKG93_08960 [Rodentibacter ratti]